jgi:hypothetical protein
MCGYRKNLTHLQPVLLFKNSSAHELSYSILKSYNPQVSWLFFKARMKRPVSGRSRSASTKIASVQRGRTGKRGT